MKTRIAGKEREESQEGSPSSPTSTRNTVVGRVIERIRRVFEKSDPAPKGPRCLECGGTAFEVGPTNGIVYNLKCAECGTYYLYIPARDVLREIHPEREW